MRDLIFLALLMFPLAGVCAGGTVGNGGDRFAQEFTNFGQTTASLLDKMKSTLLTPNQVTAFSAAVETTKVEVKDTLSINGIEVDAINFPAEKRIELSLKRWLANDSAKQRSWALAVHEYLWVAGIDDTNYRVSNPLFDEIRNFSIGLPYYSCKSQATIWHDSSPIWEDSQSANVGYVGTQSTGAKVVTFATPNGNVSTFMQVGYGSNGYGERTQNAYFAHVRDVVGNFYSDSNFESVEEALPKKFRVRLPNFKIKGTVDQELVLEFFCQSLL